MERRRSRAHTGAVSDPADPHPPEAPATAAADDRPGSRWGRIVAAILVSALVGALTFVLMAVGQSF